MQSKKKFTKAPSKALAGKTNDPEYVDDSSRVCKTQHLLATPFSNMQPSSHRNIEAMLTVPSKSLQHLTLAFAATALRRQLLSHFCHLAQAKLVVLVHAAQHALLVSSACLTLRNTLPTFTPWRSLLGSAGGTTASFVLTMGTMFIRRSS